MNAAKLIPFAIFLAILAVSIYFYPILPETLATHWNIAGKPDGYSSKLFGLFLIPSITAAVIALLYFLPNIDPLKENIRKFRKHYDWFIVILAAYMLLIQLFVINWSLGNKVSPNAIFPFGIGFLLYYLGILCEHSKRNWFIGIRTPWTLSSDKVWDKTNRLGGKLLKISGLLSFAGIAFRELALFFILLPALGSAAFLAAYSYIVYSREKKQKK